MTPRLSLSVLFDNTTLIDRYFIGKPGLSLLIETEGRRILFDTGVGLILEYELIPDRVLPAVVVLIDKQGGDIYASPDTLEVVRGSGYTRKEDVKRSFSFTEFSFPIRGYSCCKKNL